MGSLLKPQGTINRVLYGKAQPRSNPVPLSYANFDRIGISFVYLLLIMTNGPSFTYLLNPY